MLEEIFGEKNDLVEKALTHPSFTKENDINSLENYERLEFFGDSVLKLFTSKLLYEIYPEAPEGELSKIRSILVSDAILAQIAIQIGVDKLSFIELNIETAFSLAGAKEISTSFNLFQPLTILCFILFPKEIADSIILWNLSPIPEIEPTSSPACTISIPATSCSLPWAARNSYWATQTGTPSRKNKVPTGRSS